MAKPTTTSSKFIPNAYNAQERNDQMILNAIKRKESIFFGQKDKDGNVHVVIPIIRDAKNNKTIDMKQGVYIAQGLKTMGIKTNRVLTPNGAKVLGTTIKDIANQPYVEIANSIKLNEKDIEYLKKENQSLINDTSSNAEFRKNFNSKAIESGYKNVAYRYYPAFSVVDRSCLDNAFKKPNSPYIDEQKLLESKLPDKPAKTIDGNSAADWKEHVKNCISGNEVVISSEKAKELSNSMINDLENAREQGKPFLFNTTIKEASFALHKELENETIKELSNDIGIKEPEINTPQPEIESDGYDMN